MNRRAGEISVGEKINLLIIGEEDENGYSLEKSINYCFCRHCLTRILWD